MRIKLITREKEIRCFIVVVIINIQSMGKTLVVKATITITTFVKDKTLLLVIEEVLALEVEVEVEMMVYVLVEEVSRTPITSHNFNFMQV